MLLCHELSIIGARYNEKTDNKNYIIQTPSVAM